MTAATSESTLAALHDTGPSGGDLAEDQADLPAEPLTLDRLLRTAVQVALTEMNITGPIADDAEDHALERVQALLTPRARLELIAELAARPPERCLWCCGEAAHRVLWRDGSASLACEGHAQMLRGPGPEREIGQVERIERLDGQRGVA